MKASVDRENMKHRDPEAPMYSAATASAVDALRIASLAAVMSLALAGCQPAAQAPADRDTSAPPIAAAMSSTVSPAADVPAADAVPTAEEALVAATTTTTQAVLERFAAPSAPGWDAFSVVPGVTWNEVAPVAAPGALGAEDAMSRAGKLEWVDITVQAGAGPQRSDAQAQREREVGLTLLGREAVESIAFRKYRPSTEYEATLQAQLGDGATLRRIADRCARNFGSRGVNTRGSAFFELRLDQRVPLFVEGYADKDGGKYGPGYTTFEFTRTRPDTRIADMGCVAS